MARRWYGRNFPLTVALADTFVPDSTLADSRFLSAARPNYGLTDVLRRNSPSPEPKLDNHRVLAQLPSCCKADNSSPNDCYVTLHK